MAEALAPRLGKPIPRSKETEMAAPKYIKAKAEQLDRALAQVRKLNAEIIEWVDRQGEDGYDLACELGLDNAYEYDLECVLRDLDEVADRMRCEE